MINGGVITSVSYQAEIYSPFFIASPAILAGHQGFAAEFFFFGVKGFLGFAVFNDLKGPEVADSSDIADADVLVRQFIEFLL